MHPRFAEGFGWDDGNLDELTQRHHHIEAWEAEQVFQNGPVWARNKRSGSGDWKNDRLHRRRSSPHFERRDARRHAQPARYHRMGLHARRAHAVPQEDSL